MQIDFYYRTFGELKTNKELGFNDPYNIMASLNPKMREAVLHNPSGYREDETCQILALDGDVVVGATNLFTGRLRLNGEVVQTQSGSYLFSHEDYRKDNVGGELFLMATNLHISKNNFYAGLSQMALPLYKVLKYKVFEFPRLIYLLKSRSVVQSVLRYDGFWTKPLVWFIDAILLFRHKCIRLVKLSRLKKYNVEEVKVVPREVEDIVMSDDHPFMELHDKAWFEWSLNYSISEDPRTKKKLFVVKNAERIEAFFLIKQEFFEKASSRGFENVYLGSVMEWGIAKESILKESDLALLSLFYFDNNVDGIQYSSSDLATIKDLKHYLFIQVGYSSIGFKIHTTKDPSLKDINNWRVRLAASDTVLN